MMSDFGSLSLVAMDKQSQILLCDWPKLCNSVDDGRWIKAA